MRICFCARPCYDKFSTEIFLSIKQYHDEEIEGVFLTSDKYESAYVRHKVNGAAIKEIGEFMSGNWSQFNKEELAIYEKKYGCAPIWRMIYSDRFLVNHDHEYCMKITVGLFGFFESLFADGGIDFYYDETIATLQSYVAYIVGQHFGVTYISQMVARGNDSTHHYFLCDPYQYNMNFDDSYLSKTYSADLVMQAAEYLKHFEENCSKPRTMMYTKTKPQIGMNGLLAPIRWMRNRISPKYNNPYVYMYYKGYRNTFSPISDFLRYQASRRFYKKADFGRKYVYFPLHLQPEASTIVCAQKYEKQIFFIDSWAKSLPADTFLYVKEHYAGLGSRSIAFYEQLREYPNVVLIDPWEDTFRLIKGAVAVTTLTGTAGWEAMLLRKAVFLGGKIVFDNAPGIIKVDDIFDNYLSVMGEWVQPTREAVIHYLCEYFSSIYLGNVYAENYNNIECYNHDNINRVAESLYKQLEKIQQDAMLLSSN